MSHASIARMISLIFVLLGLTGLVSRKLKVTASRELSGLPAHLVGAGFLLLAIWLQVTVSASDEELRAGVVAGAVRRSNLPHFTTDPTDLRLLCTLLAISAGLVLALCAISLAKEVGPRSQLDRGPSGARALRSAPRVTRLCCWVLDFALLFSPVLVVHGVATLLGRDTPQDIQRVTPIIGFVSVAIYVLQCVMMASSGQTLARSWFGIRVARPNGSPPGFVRGVALRSWLPAAAAALTPAWPFLGLLLLFDAARVLGREARCLHDLIADTIVVTTTQRPRDARDWSEA